MSDIAIRCEGLGKRYRIGERERYKALRDVITDAAAAPLRRLRNAFESNGHANGNGDKLTSNLRPPTSDLFWALKDVSFVVKPGEVVGIIGRNGAGKSTLLKILSRITAPTEGEVEIKGRVGSLLEVGTGFHPELTGRENIYLNGAILGMKRAEINRKFDEMVVFAEIEKFIDTPVKRYSSGMYVRLAFAVAAHLDPEILLVDEVLAVGDAQFQKKCLGKMGDVAKEGRTVLFVSHNMAAVQNLCGRGILLAQGRVEVDSAIPDVISHYTIESNRIASLSFNERSDRKGSGLLQFKSVVLKDGNRLPVKAFTCGAPAILEISLSNASSRSLHNVRIAAGIDNNLEQRLVVFSTHLADQDFCELPGNFSTVEIYIPRLTLTEGRYSFTLFSSVNGEVADWLKNAGSFQVEGGDFYGSGQMPPSGQGCIVMDHDVRIV